MTTVTIGVATMDDVHRSVIAAFDGEYQGHYITFLSPERMWEVLSAKRWEILKAMLGQGPMSIRELARRVNRDVKSVHGDVHKMLGLLIDKTDDGRIVFPYDAVKVDFTIEADKAA